jgi:hypothetical protein
MIALGGRLFDDTIALPNSLDPARKHPVTQVKKKHRSTYLQACI